MATDKTIIAGLERLCTNYGKDISDALVDLWTAEFSDAADDLLTEAIKAHIRKSEYFPRVAEIVRLMDSAGQTARHDGAVEANRSIQWGEAMDAFGQLLRGEVKALEPGAALTVRKACEPYRDWRRSVLFGGMIPPAGPDLDAYVFGKLAQDDTPADTDGWRARMVEEGIARIHNGKYQRLHNRQDGKREWRTVDDMVFAPAEYAEVPF